MLRRNVKKAQEERLSDEKIDAGFWHPPETRSSDSV